VIRARESPARDLEKKKATHLEPSRLGENEGGEGGRRKRVGLFGGKVSGGTNKKYLPQSLWKIRKGEGMH